jgi:hypothetical protein
MACGFGMVTLGVIVSTKGKLDHEARSDSFIAPVLHRNRAAVGLHQALHHVQTDSGSSFPSLGVTLTGKANESFEHPLAVFDRHAGAFIGDRQKCLGTITADIDRDRSSPRAVTHSVVEKVGENTVEFEEVAFDDGVPMVDQPECHMGVSQNPGLDRLAGHSGQVDRLPVETGTALLDLPEVEQLVEELY